MREKVRINGPNRADAELIIYLSTNSYATGKKNLGIPSCTLFVVQASWKKKTKRTILVATWSILPNDRGVYIYIYI